MKYLLHYDCIGCGPIEHPMNIMKKLSERKVNDGTMFKIIKGVGHSIGDCWLFLVESKLSLSYLPCYVTIIKEGEDLTEEDCY